MAKQYSKSKQNPTKNKAANTKGNNASTLPDIIGGPPESGGTTTGMDLDVIRKNSALLIHIKPCTTVLDKGISLFSIKEDWLNYKSLLRDVGYNTTNSQNSTNGITVSAMAESFPTDTFTNEYGEHFLNSITNALGGGFGEMAQMMGSKTATDAASKFGKILSDVGGSIGGTIGSAVSGAGNGLDSGAAGTQKSINKLQKEGGLKGQIASSINEMLAGARIDFPQVWKNSSYNPSFSCTIRLYNPNPGSLSATKKYIAGPLAALLTLALPQGKSEGSYTWPFFCKVECRGLFKIPMGGITNITVTKGGDSGLVAFNQRVSIVDVRMDFVNLHSTLLLTKFASGSRPTLKTYLDNITDSMKIKKMYVQDDYKLPSWQTAKSLPGDVKTTPNSATPIDPTTAPVSRVDQSKKSQETNLINQGPIIT